MQTVRHDGARCLLYTPHAREYIANSIISHSANGKLFSSSFPKLTRKLLLTLQNSLGIKRRNVISDLSSFPRINFNRYDLLFHGKQSLTCLNGVMILNRSGIISSCEANKSSAFVVSLASVNDRITDSQGYSMFINLALLRLGLRIFRSSPSVRIPFELRSGSRNKERHDILKLSPEFFSTVATLISFVPPNLQSHELEFDWKQVSSLSYFSLLIDSRHCARYSYEKYTNSVRKIEV